MVRNHTPGPRDLGRELVGVAEAMLEYKADWYGRTVIAVDRWYPSSKTCSVCGVITAKLPLAIREWVCASCGVRHGPGRERGEGALGRRAGGCCLRRWCETTQHVVPGGDRR